MALIVLYRAVEKGNIPEFKQGDKVFHKRQGDSNIHLHAQNLASYTYSGSSITEAKNSRDSSQSK